MNRFIKKHNQMVNETRETKSYNKLVKSKKGWLKISLGTTFAIATLFAFSAGNEINADVNSGQQTEQVTEQQSDLANSSATTDESVKSTENAGQSDNVKNVENQVPSAQKDNYQTSNYTSQQSNQQQSLLNLNVSPYPSNPGDALLNQAYIQTGTLKVDMQGPSGTVYPAGTKVARATREQGNWGNGNDWYLSLDVAQFVLTGYGSVDGQYVNETSEYHVNNLQNGDVWASQSAKNSQDAYGSLTPSNITPPPAQTVDKSGLQSAISKAVNIDQSQYTDSSSQNLQTALNDAETVNANSGATQSMVDNASNSLNTAINGLVKKDIPSSVNKSALEAEISTAKSVDASQYTDDSVAQLNNALAYAESVDANENASQDLVDNATANLNKAVEELVEKEVPTQNIDKSVLEDAIKKAQDIDLSQYTDKSVEGLSSALITAQNVDSNSNATQDEVDNASSILLNSISSLVEKSSSSANKNSDDYDNQAWVQVGELNQPMKGFLGHIYPAGTKVSRSNPVKDDLNQSDFHLTLEVSKNGTNNWNGSVESKYVKILDTYQVTDLQNGDVWPTKSDVSEGDQTSELHTITEKPANDQNQVGVPDNSSSNSGSSSASGETTPADKSANGNEKPANDQNQGLVPDNSSSNSGSSYASGETTTADKSANGNEKPANDTKVSNTNQDSNSANDTQTVSSNNQKDGNDSNTIPVKNQNDDSGHTVSTQPASSQNGADVTKPVTVNSNSDEVTQHASTQNSATLTTNTANNNNQQDALPQTGSRQNEAFTISGILFIIASLFLAMFKFLKPKKNN